MKIKHMFTDRIETVLRFWSIKITFMASIIAIVMEYYVGRQADEKNNNNTLKCTIIVIFECYRSDYSSCCQTKQDGRKRISSHGNEAGFC